MIVLLDNGHGGLINGIYQTPGKRVDWGAEGIIYEGEFNRAIVSGIMQALTTLKIPYVNICPEHKDITLQTRVRRANKYSPRNSFYLSVHANASGPSGIGNGAEIFTSVNPTKSDLIATIFGEEFKQEFPNERLREDTSDGDLDKEFNYHVLRYTKMPAILTENFFMDNFTHYKNIHTSPEGRQRIINYHVKAILRAKTELF